MHNFWIFFLQRRAFTYLLMFVLSLGGIVSLIAIPKESTPEVVVPVGIVQTILPGASAPDTERLVTDVIEKEIAGLTDIDTITSSSVEGASIVVAQFNASADVDRAIDDLKQVVDRAKVKFPDEAEDPSVMKVDFAAQPIMILSLSASLSPQVLSNVAENLADEIERVGGVSSVSISGNRDREIQLIIKKSALERYNIRIGEVVAAIRQGNASLPIGSITVADIDYPVSYKGDIIEATEIGKIQLSRGSGAPLYIRDIGTVIDGVAKSTTYTRASLGGEPGNTALTLTIFKKQGGDITSITDRVRERLSELEATLLEEIDTVVSFDNGEYIRRDIRELVQVGIETVLLVMLSLFLTIGWRESVVAALSIPLSFVIAFIGLYASGNTINVVSLFSLILAIGILVDSGIVVTEAIHTRYRKLGNANDAAIASIKEYAWPLIAGTMATVVFFVPLFFISGIVGQFIKSIPFTLVFVLLASIWVALGMVPLIAILMAKRTETKFEAIQEHYTEKAKLWYMNLLRTILSSRKTQNWIMVLMSIGLVVAIILPIVGLVKVEFFPSEDQDIIYVSIEKPEGTPIAITDLSAREVEEFLYDEKDIVSFVTTVGQSSAFSGDGPGGGGGSSNSKLANITINLSKDRIRTSQEIGEELRNKLSVITSAEVRVNQLDGGPPSGAPILIKFYGDDLDQLTKVADAAERLLESIPGTRDVDTSSKNDGAQFTISIDRNKAGALGVSSADIAGILRTAVSGVVATTIKNKGDDIDVRVALDLNPEFQSIDELSKISTERLLQLPIATERGTILLGSVVSVELAPNRASINHEDQKRVVSVQSYTEGDSTPYEINSIFREREAELNLPENITIDYGGENEDVNKSFAEMGFALLAGMALVLAILVLEFNSFRYSLYLILIIFPSLIGVMFGLMITGQTLSFSSTIGLIALAGVIVNHAIILLDSLIHMVRSRTDLPLLEVVIEASAVRLRPIFLTTLTTVIGMVPLAGASALWGPLAFTIMFGLAFSMTLTLVLVPILFARWPGKLMGESAVR